MAKFQWGWMRHPKTTQERCRNGRPEEREFVRPKRSPRQLPTAYDDVWVKHSKSWKERRQRKQWG